MLKKQYLKSKSTCKVTFTLPTDAIETALEIRVLGDFNDWNWDQGTVMKESKAEYKAVLELATGQDYEFRYVAADGAWENDWAADAYVPSPYTGIENSVVSVAAAVAKAVKGKGEAAPKSKPKTKATSDVKKVATKATKTTKDNLKLIEGIGPKIAQILNEKGILTFTDLSKAKITFLKDVLAGAGSRFKMHDPSTWAEQAKLAAAGEKEKLAQLQAELKGGKR
jgi:predicted flap endonuclease-1-like 5' DNA nuclease